MQVDVLITKRDAEKHIRKNIGQIFKKYNLIEYKSPDDYVCINDYHKVLGYAHFFVADTVHVNEISCKELSISFVSLKYPQKLMKHIVSKGCEVEKKEDGIYYVYGEQFAIQIIVCSALPEESNLWLRNLTNKMKETASVEKLARAYEKHKENKLYSSVMDILIRANVAKFSEVKNMCEALKELFKEELEEKWQDGLKVGISQGISQGINQGTRLGVINTLVQLVQDGLLSLQVAAERAQMSTEEFQKQL